MAVELVNDGPVTLILDSGEYVLKPGDAVIMRGDRHAWRNDGSEPALMAAAVTAHAAAERYEYLLVEYRRTAGQLKHLKRTAAGDADFVDRCESVISTQNQGWMAKFAEMDTAP